jgi:two-component system, OmpR family, phosphate regulon sensor histidine kinase PhoR
MKQPRRWPTIVVLIATQIAWLIIVVLGVIWYIQYHHIRIKPIGVWDIVLFIEVSILLILILSGIYVLFILYQKQLTLMRTQMHIISSITHAFKTPLATMQLYLETIKKRDLPEKTREELLDGMLAVNQRLKSLVYNFLESARLSNQYRPYTLSSISAADFIKNYCINHEVFLKDVKLHIQIDNDVTISLDTDAFEMVFSNLIENAIHYSTSAPRVDIRVWSKDKWAYIELSDMGIGIPRARHRDVFKMFKRLPEAVSIWGSGTGMGLYVVKAIIKSHGGTIQVSGKNKEEGTSFIIRLPVANK